MQIRWATRVLTAGIAAVLGAGCGGAKQASSKTTTMTTGAPPKSLRVPTVDPSLCDTDGKKVVTADLDRDGNPDVWKMYATAVQDGTNVEVLTCKQVDFDHDGRKDYVATYLKTGDKVAEEFDFGFDGEFDAREHFDKKAGTPTVVERDTDHDKRPDMWERYKDGVLESVHRDRNGDGKPDLWETYDAAGQLNAILLDDDFDGRVDRKESARRAPGPVNDLPSATRPAGPVDENPVEPTPAATAPKPTDAPAGQPKAPAKKK